MYLLFRRDYPKAALQSAGNLVTGTVIGAGLGYAQALMTNPITGLGGAYALTQIPRRLLMGRTKKISVEEQKAIDRGCKII